MIEKSKWFSLSFDEQMGNLAAEISRAKNWENQGELIERNNAIVRAFDLIDLIVQDERWKGRRREILQFREVLGAIYCNSKIYTVTLERLQNYCMPFALKARWNR